MKAHKNLFVIFFWAISAVSAKASILDLKSFSTKNFLISTTSTGCMPKGMKIDPVGNFLYVAEMCGKIDPVSKKRVPTASIFDLEKRTLSKTLVTPLGVKNGILANTEVEFSLDELWGFITRSEGDSKSEIYKNFGLLTVVNTDTQKIAKYIPLNGSGSKIIASRPYVRDDIKHEQIIYVANYFSDNISIVDVTNLREDGHLDGTAHFKGLIPLHTSYRNPRSRGYLIAPRGIAFTPDGKYALVLATETGSLIIVDAVKHQQIAELAPISSQTAGRDLNLRHIVVANDGETAYISHMRGNAISRIHLSTLIQKINTLHQTGMTTTLPSSTWDELLIPFNTALGPVKILILEDYPNDHPNFPGQKWNYSHPNTIVLEPIRNRYLYVSSRTTTNSDDSKVDPKIMGKIDIIDTEKDRVVFSLVGGAQPTALEVSRDGKTLISAGLINDKLYFYDLKKIINLYEIGE
ncbi:MAG: beta-propeller fold lactonase family protein [Bacteriovorax sp.]|nr:beta-propeller fold lactonase family protein [Bacteriovorax sp.]